MWHMWLVLRIHQASHMATYNVSGTEKFKLPCVQKTETEMFGEYINKREHEWIGNHIETFKYADVYNV